MPILDLLSPQHVLANVAAADKAQLLEQLAAMLAGGLIGETAMTRTCPLNEIFGVDTRERPLISGPSVRAPEEYTNPKQVYG